MSEKPEKEKAILETQVKIFTAYYNPLSMDKPFFVETALGQYPLDKFLVEVLQCGGTWQSLGAAEWDRNGSKTIMYSLFVVIPVESEAIKFIIGEAIIKKE